MKRNATAVWQGTGKEGAGNLTTQSPALKNASYAYNTRFENSPGTNPEELIAAAHAGCFTMKLAFVITAAGFTPDRLETNCQVTLENGAITTSHLTVKAKVTGITADKFQEAAEDAKKNCPVSKVLNASISMEASLV